MDYAGAIYKPTTAEWIWIVARSRGDKKTVIYEVTVPDDATSQDYNIAGHASVYGVSPVEIGGKSTVTVEPSPPTYLCLGDCYEYFSRKLARMMAGL